MSSRAARRRRGRAAARECRERGIRFHGVSQRRNRARKVFQLMVVVSQENPRRSLGRSPRDDSGRDNPDLLIIYV
jgi:hypothetical protein